ncbi:MAG TPA: ORF6N domain-containing protein [Candidatus Limnocylindria bacterium]|nr:ORF6N domain-containing protein [Candidatus Limnocylindria bacterium]
MPRPARAPSIAERILLIRGERVLLDSDLAELYAVPTAVLNQAVSRSAGRLPADLAFRLTREEFRHLRSQAVISRSRK